MPGVIEWKSLWAAGKMPRMWAALVSRMNNNLLLLKTGGPYFDFLCVQIYIAKIIIITFFKFYYTEP